MVPLMTLHRRRHAIAAAWWFMFLGGPIWAVLVVALIRRGRHTRTLRWVVD